MNPLEIPVAATRNQAVSNLQNYSEPDPMERGSI
jgi:hypothetical protein